MGTCSRSCAASMSRSGAASSSPSSARPAPARARCCTCSARWTAPPPVTSGSTPRTARSRAEEVLSEVGLAGRMTHRPAELSGGEQQRCAVARALVHDPSLVLADEPSGNLDHANSDRLHEVFFRLAREYETAVVVVTHNRQLAGRADRILMLDDGRLAAVSSVDAIP